MIAETNQHLSLSWMLNKLNHVLLTCFANFSFGGILVNGGVVIISEATSSPNHIIATKGSSVWLHWNYTYVGDGTHEENVHFISKYREQIIEINSIFQARVQTLAKRIGQNGPLQLESPTPAPFDGRVEVISSNSTLLINDVQYNDSTYRFSSDVNVEIDIFAVAPVLHDFKLKPIVSLTVIGIPEFIAEPPTEIEVNENSPFELRIEMAGNPEPKAYFKWIHRSSLSVVNASSSLSNPFQYYAAYKMNNFDPSFCGKQLQTTLRNNLGSSTTKYIRVIVLLKLDQPLNLKAERLPSDGCVKVSWKKMKSAACKVKYLVKLKDAYGNEVDKSYGYNIGEMKMCNVLPHVHVADVELTVHFRTVEKTVTTTVGGNRMLSSRKEVLTTPGTVYSSGDNKKSKLLQSTNALSTFSINYPAFKDSRPAASLRSTKINIYIVVGILAAVAMVVVLSMAFILMRMMKASGRGQEQSRKHTDAEAHYMELQPQSSREKSEYAQLVNEYEEIPERSLDDASSHQVLSEQQFSSVLQKRANSRIST